MSREAMGKNVSDEYRNEKHWDSNAITPGEFFKMGVSQHDLPFMLLVTMTGTPFMDLLASSLRYWVARKLNEDPGWAGVSLVSLSWPKVRFASDAFVLDRAASGHHLRCISSRRRRAQDHGLYSPTESTARTRS